MRKIRSSGSVEGVMGNHDSYSDSACTAIVVRRTAAGKVLARRLAAPTSDVCPRGTQWHRLQCARRCAQTRSEIHPSSANANQATNEKRA